MAFVTIQSLGISNNSQNTCLLLSWFCVNNPIRFWNVFIVCVAHKEMNLKFENIFIHKKWIKICETIQLLFNQQFKFYLNPLKQYSIIMFITWLDISITIVYHWFKSEKCYKFTTCSKTRQVWVWFKPCCTWKMWI